MSKLKKEQKAEQNEDNIGEAEIEVPFAENIEQWCLINGHNKYETSSFGRVRNNKTKKILKQSILKDGYKNIILRKNGVKINYRVHRLVAEAFCEKPDGCDIVDHIDKNKTNNMFSNLRWTTTQGNNRNRSISTNNSSGTSGVCYDKSTEVWCAYICDNNNNRLSKSFSCNKHDNAKEKAIMWRKQKEEEFGYL